MRSTPAWTLGQKANREVKKEMKEVKEEWIEEQCIIIDKEMTAGSSKKAYITLKPLMKTSQLKLVLHQMLMGISLQRVPKSKTGGLKTAVTPTTTRFKKTPASVGTTPDQKRTTRRMSFKLKAKVEEVVRSLKAANLRERTASFQS
ncbi:hypothetical protein DPMN_058220 [Dreissena polymorpha]|uniref:Uncharacterized protein n=1 Tax=Dreissena polymorpha TaxID=45954 RepID=A0A9D4C1L9_DREPO|nr:hypothetical protein DPMN_058220 [Dreissena polymorpha]